MLVKINFIKHNQKFSGPANCPIGEPFVSKGAGNLYELGNDYDLHRISLFQTIFLRSCLHRYINRLTDHFE